MNKIIKIIVGVCIIGVALFGIIVTLKANKEKIDEKATHKPTEVPVAVTVTNATKQALSTQLTLLGTIFADKEMVVVSETQGKVVELSMALGDYKKQGDQLVRVDDEKLQIQLKTVEATIDKLKTDIQRLRNLSQSQAIPDAKLREAELGLIQTEAQATQLRLQIRDTKIIAPMNGIITNKMVEKGSVLGGGTAVAMMVDVSKLKAKVKVPEIDVYKLNVGTSVIITTDIYPNYNVNGIITYISPQGDEAHNYGVEIAFVNNAATPLKAGTYITATFPSILRTNTLTIQREALVGSLKNPQVFVIENGKATLKKIAIGVESKGLVEVLSGIEETDNVVMTGQINLSEGAKVNIIKGGDN